MITLQELVKKLEETEWNTLEQIQSRQEACLARIVDHHSRYNPHLNDDWLIKDLQLKMLAHLWA